MAELHHQSALLIDVSEKYRFIYIYLGSVKTSSILHQNLTESLHLKSDFPSNPNNLFKRWLELKKYQITATEQSCLKYSSYI